MIAILLFGLSLVLIVLVTGIFESIRWILRFNKQVKADQELGISLKAELITQIRNGF